MGTIIELCPNQPVRRVHLHRRYLSEPHALWDNHVCYSLALPPGRERERALRQTQMIQAPQWAAAETPSLPGLQVCDGQKLSVMLQLLTMTDVSKFAGQQVVLTGFSAAETSAAFVLLVEIGVELVLYEREIHVAEVLARHLYHRSGRVVQTLLTPSAAKDMTIIRRGITVPKIRYQGNVVAPAVTEAAMLSDTLPLDCNERTIETCLDRIREYGRTNGLIFA